MLTETRKLHIIDEVLKIDDEVALAEIERLVEDLKKEKPKTDFREFAGIWTKEEADAFEKVINESCENISPEDWK